MERSDGWVAEPFRQDEGHARQTAVIGSPARFHVRGTFLRRTIMTEWYRLKYRLENRRTQRLDVILTSKVPATIAACDDPVSNEPEERRDRP